jgi:hypothetical protein
MGDVPKNVTIEPAKRGGDYLVAGFHSQSGMSITDTEYHAHHKAIMDMRSSDPATAKQYDKFLKEVVDTRGGSWAHADVDNLRGNLAKHTLSLNSVTNSIGSDLRKHGYSSTYRPEVLLSVNGRHMTPGNVIAELKDAKIEGNFDRQRSHSAGSVSGKPISFPEAEISKLVPQTDSRIGSPKDGAGSKLIKGEIVSHSGVNTSRMGSGLIRVGAGVATGLAAGVAAAQEPDATPKSVAVATADQAVPGFKEARQPGSTVASTAVAAADDVVPGFKLGRQGHLCQAFGEMASVTAQGLTYAAGATATTALAVASSPSVVAPVAIAAAGSVLTVKAAEGAGALGAATGEAACNSISGGINKIKTAFGLGS